MTKAEYIGGGMPKLFRFEELLPHLSNPAVKNTRFKFHSYMTELDACALEPSAESLLAVNYLFEKLLPHLCLSELKLIAVSHGIYTHSKMSKSAIQSAIIDHICQDCDTWVSVFELADNSINEIARKNVIAVHKSNAKDPENYRQSHLAAVQRSNARDPEQYKQNNLAAVQRSNAKDPEQYKQKNLAAVQKSNAQDPEQSRKLNTAAVHKFIAKTNFPPSPPSLKLQHTIISNWCKDMSPEHFMESGCAVCGELMLLTQLQKLSTLDNIDLDVLRQDKVTRNERNNANDPIADLD